MSNKNIKVSAGASSDGDTDISENAIWVSTFDADSLEAFFIKFDKLEQNLTMPIIPIYINSYGGELYVVLAMRDLIKSTKKMVATIAVGTAMSAASLLLASGTKGLRFAAPSTRIMIHEASGGAIGKASEVESDLKCLMEDNEVFLSALAKDCGKTVNQIRKAMINNADLFLTATKAKEFGLIDHIEIPKLRPSDYKIGLQVSAACEDQLSNPKKSKANKNK
jgi:ATP-dependent Clp protease protease subunit